ncbi:MAG TPA: hypothetical protein VEV16_11225 [Daejeonella sp.]|nr:hypothetical protein [Daejeonella sp.]
MNTQTLEIYEIFKRQLGEPEAAKVVAYFEDVKDKEISLAVERKIEHLATKEDLAKQIGDLKADTIKWMFIFWLGQITVIGGLILTVLKLK